MSNLTTADKKFQGLTPDEVRSRVESGLVNATDLGTSRSLASIFRANVLTRFNALLGILFLVVLWAGSPIDALFGLVIVVNSSIGVFQELRARRTLDALAILNSPTAVVRRDGQEIRLPSTDIVQDDLILVGAGDQVLVDGRLVVSQGIEVNEALLTGESQNVEKAESETLLSGSTVVAGSGVLIASAVGVDSYIYKLSKDIKKFSIVDSELVNGTNLLLKYISWVILLVAPILVIGQLVNQKAEWREAIVRSSAGVVGMIPEGLVLLTSIAFMLSALALARKKVLVQQLPAVEGLARVNVVCLDKTGTLTEGSMDFHSLKVYRNHSEPEVRDILGLFAKSANSATLEALAKEFPNTSRVADGVVAFSSERKWSALYSGKISWVLGAPDVLARDDDSKVYREAKRLSESGFRVLSLFRTTRKLNKTVVDSELEPVALICLSERLRDGARETLQYFARENIGLKIISGDNPATVAEIAKNLGLEIIGKPVNALGLPTDQATLTKCLQEHNVFGRVKPDQKRSIIKALQASGLVVAMTGDGVNDALALKDADVGIAMASGSQSARVASEIVLLDDSFTHLPMILSEGRRVIANIERVANLFVIKNVYSMMLALLVTVTALPYPFMPRHMTIISSLTIGIPAFFLALAPNNQRYVKGFLKRVLFFALPIGILISVLVMSAYAYLRANLASANHISTASSIIIFMVGLTVIACLARPYVLWKILLITSMGLLFIALLASSWSQSILGYELTSTVLITSLALGAFGSLLTVVIYQKSKTLRQG